MVDEAISDTVAVDAHRFQDTSWAVVGFWKHVFSMDLNLHQRFVLVVVFLTAVLLTSLPACAWQREDTRETLEDLNVQLLCGIPAL